MYHNLRKNEQLKTLKNLTSFINNIPITEVVSHLGLQLSQVGSNLQGHCPTGHTSEHGKCFNVNIKGNYFYCFSCNIGGDNISLVQESYTLSFYETLKWFVKEFSIEHSVDFQKYQGPILSEEEKAEQQKTLVYATYYEAAFNWMHQLLFEDAGKEALEYLVKERNYDLEILKRSDFCFFPKEGEIKKYLREQFPDNPELVELLPLYGGYGDNFRLAIPYRNKNGIIIGLVKRATIPEGISLNGKSGIRWDSTKGVKKDDLFYLHKINDEDTLLIVEGYPDAVYLSAAGMNNITAVGQGQLSSKHLEGLKELKIKNVIISFDNDDVGPDNTRHAVRLLLEESNIFSFVLDPHLMTPHKDPDEYVKANGLQAFESLLKKCEKGVVWLVKQILNDCDRDNVIAKEKTMSELWQLIAINKDSQVIAEISGMVSREMGIEKAVLNKMIKEYISKYKVEAYEKLKGNPSGRFMPFIEKSTSTYSYYDEDENEVYLGVNKEVLENILLSSKQVLPDVLPVLKVDFDVMMNERYDIEKEKFNFFIPTEYMLLEKKEKEIKPTKQFPSIEKLLVNLLPNTEERLRYINWLAGILQTRQKQQTAWVFKGKPGAGKGIMLDHILKPLFGSKQAIKVEDQQLKADFNPWLQNALLIAFNEVAHDNNSRNTIKSKIKAIITDSEVIINEKNIRNYTITNYVNCLFFSNEEVPVFIEQGDRRFNVVVTGGNLREKEWFNDPDEFIKGFGKEVPAFAQFLMNWSYDKQLAMTCIDNEEKEMMVGAAMNKFEEFATYLKNNDVSWFESNASYAMKEHYRNIEGKILKSSALKLFADIYSSYSTTDVEFGKKLKLYGIKPFRERKGGVDMQYYIWKGEKNEHK